MSDMMELSCGLSFCGTLEWRDMKRGDSSGREMRGGWMSGRQKSLVGRRGDQVSTSEQVNG